MTSDGTDRFTREPQAEDELLVRLSEWEAAYDNVTAELSVSARRVKALEQELHLAWHRVELLEQELEYERRPFRKRIFRRRPRA